MSPIGAVEKIMAPRIIIKIDNALFSGLFHRLRQIKKIFKLELLTSHKIQINYSKNQNDLLSSLCVKHGSDKGELTDEKLIFSWRSHNYADFYSIIFDHTRNSVKKVFECGLGTNNTDVPSNMGADGKPGASLRVWRDYFPNANIYGADIDKRVLFEEPRIKTFYVDQCDPIVIDNMWAEIETKDFDLIIDDGLHTFEAGKCLFENSINNLSQSGIYIIEDVSIPDLVKYQEFFKNKNYNVKYINLIRSTVNVRDNNMVMIRHSTNIS